MGRGGLLINVMVGLAVTHQAVDALARSREPLEPAEARRIIERLQSVDRQAEPLGVLIDRDSQFFYHSGGLQMKAAWVVSGPTLRKLAQPAYDGTDIALKRISARLRLLVADVAIRTHRRETGMLPANLAALVPRYLPNVPADPFGRGPLVYRPGPDGFLLYSLGPDGRDDGGQPIPERQWAAGVWGDVLLDSTTTPSDSGQPTPSDSDPKK